MTSRGNQSLGRRCAELESQPAARACFIIVLTLCWFAHAQALLLQLQGVSRFNAVALGRRTKRQQYQEYGEFFVTSAGGDYDLARAQVKGISDFIAIAQEKAKREEHDFYVGSFADVITGPRHKR